jgi:hypothetical protein
MQRQIGYSMPEYNEYPVANWKDWVRLEIKAEDGSTKRNYRSPGGVVISNYEWGKKSAKYRSQGYIPENDLTPIGTSNSGPALLPSRAASKRVVEGTISPPPNQSIPVSPDEEQLQQQQFFTSQQTAYQDVGRKAQPSQRPPASPPREDIPDEEPVFIAPDPKLDTSKGRAGNKATPKELADGLYISLTIVTSIVALIVGAPEINMTDMEAKAIAIPAANLIARSKLNERFGRMIAESGDWQLLGYAIWMYFSRVTEVIRAKNAQRQPVNRQQYTPPIQQNGHTPQPSPAPAMPLNPGYKGPPGVQRYG